ncbi:MAG: hypothetical protein NTW30_03970 [Candidatus Aenigmarchaeota archaeon]|nr:hypothetical protein [Candidatus Aenigmarchaeota archaeon]
MGASDEGGGASITTEEPKPGKILADLYRINEKYIPLVRLMKEAGLLKECATWENWEKFAHRLGFKSGGDLLKTIEGMTPESAMTIKGALIEVDVYSRVDELRGYMERALNEAGIRKGSQLYADMMEAVSAKFGKSEQKRNYSQS